MKSLYGYDSFAFVFAHPDDEMNTACIIKSLVDAGKKVDLIYVTSGDRRGPAVGLQREQEVMKATAMLGVPASNLHLLGFSEPQFEQMMGDVVDAVQELLDWLAPECIVSHDYEGGHHHHDLTSYCAHRGAREMGADMWVFPAYHKQPHNRVWNDFIDGLKADFSLKLDQKQASLKTELFNAHGSQKQFFDRLFATYGKENLLQREVLRFVTKDILYTSKPTDPIGYEFPGSPFKFSAFLATLARVHARTQSKRVRQSLR